MAISTRDLLLGKEDEKQKATRTTGAAVPPSPPDRQYEQTTRTTGAGTLPTEQNNVPQSNTPQTAAPQNGSTQTVAGQTNTPQTAAQQTSRKTAITLPPAFSKEADRVNALNNVNEKLATYGGAALRGELSAQQRRAADEEDYGYSPEFMVKWREYKDNRDKSTADLVAALKASDSYKPLSEEDKKKEEKKRRRDAIFAAIGDGVQALSNLYFTTKGALNSYDPKNSLSAKAQERWDRLDAGREKEKANHLNLMLKINALRDAADKDELGWMKEFENVKARRKAQKAEDRATAAAAAAKQRNADRDYGLKKAKQEADAKRADEAAKEQARHNRAQEAIGRRRNAISASKGGGRSSNSSYGGDGTAGSYTIRLHDGSIQQYDKSRTGALTALAPMMKRKAEAASKRYAAKGDKVRAAHYGDIAEKLEGKANTKETMAAIVAENVWDFPSMDAEVRKAIGIGGGFDVNTYKHKSTTSTKGTVQRPPLN